MARKGYEVGYKRPPVSSQYKKGQTGNKNGRPKRNPSLAAAFDAEASRTVKFVNKNGRSTKITVTEAIIKRILADAARGEKYAIVAFLKLHAQFKPASNADLELTFANIVREVMKDDE